MRQVYGDLTENSENRQDVESEAISGPVQEEATVDEFDFRLFLGEVGEDAKRVALGSPPPLNSEPGFVRPRRGDDYYFTGTRTAEAMEGFRSVVAGWEEVVKGARVSWVCGLLFLERMRGFKWLTVPIERMGTAMASDYDQATVFEEEQAAEGRCGSLWRRC